MASGLEETAMFYGVDGVAGVSLRGRLMLFGVEVPERLLDPIAADGAWAWFAAEVRAVLSFDTMFHVQCLRELFRFFGLYHLLPQANEAWPHGWPSVMWLSFAKDARKSLAKADAYMAAIAPGIRRRGEEK